MRMRLVYPILATLLWIASDTAKTKSESSPLHEAAKTGNTIVLQLLLAGGADLNINIKDSDDCTALHYAAMYGHEDVATLLLSHGADVNAKGHRDDATPLHDAAEHGFAGVTRILLASGANPGAVDKNGATPLHLAAARGQTPLVRLLIDHDADVNAADKSGSSPLHFGAGSLERDVVEFLLMHGADVNAKTVNGETPLCRAAQIGCRNVAELLLTKGADVNGMVSNYRQTPLIEAAYYGHTDVVALLVASGADVHRKSINGETALEKATYMGFADVVRLLSGDVNSPSFVKQKRYSVIVIDPRAVRVFPRDRRMPYDEAWIPDAADVQGLDSVLKSHLENMVVKDSSRWLGREYTLPHLRQYSREYSGFTRDGVRYIICNLILEPFPREPYDPPLGSSFSIMRESDWMVLSVIFDVQSRTVSSISTIRELL
jgi:ankyrin repeat protein